MESQIHLHFKPKLIFLSFVMQIIEPTLLLSELAGDLE